jgi:hypothetical protein
MYSLRQARFIAHRERQRASNSTAIPFERSGR